MDSGPEDQRSRSRDDSLEYVLQVSVPDNLRPGIGRRLIVGQFVDGIDRVHCQAETAAQMISDQLSHIPHGPLFENRDTGPDA